MPVIDGLVADLFRHQSGRLIALLVRAIGARHLQLAEDVVQEALISALHVWPMHGVPENPPAWLMQVARRKALDALRRNRMFAERVEPVLIRSMTPTAPDEADALDDALALMFMTCHPSLPAESRIALTLKVACGFSVEEIARGLLADTRAVAQRLVRAKRQLRDEGIEVTVPGDDELEGRLENVLEALALMFTEGYGARSGDLLVREDVCVEALRLARLLVRHPRTAVPASHALVSLLLLQSARLPARLTDTGALAVLGEQDRSKWLWPLIHEALHHLDLSATGAQQTVWHLQAAIASMHALASSLAETPWHRIVPLYDDLVRLRPTGVVRLNRAIAIGMRDGAPAGLEAMRELDGDPRLRDYHLLHAARARFHRDTHSLQDARASLERALDCPASAPERRFLRAQLLELSN